MQESSEMLAAGLVQMAQRREEDVAGNLRDLQARIEEAGQALGTGRGSNSEDRLRRALTEAGNLAEKLESLKSRAEGLQPEPGQSGRNSESEGRGENQGERSGESQSPSGTPTGQPGLADGESGRRESESGGQPGESRRSPDTPPRFAGAGTGLGLDPQSAGREWRERLREADELRRQLEGIDPGLAADAARLMRRMRALDLERILADPGEVVRLKSQIIDGFHQLELQISGMLRDGRDEYLRPVDEYEIPPEFRDRVEEYYRRLAARRQQ
jgi:hypothetical protein